MTKRFEENDGGEWYYREFMPLSPRSKKVKLHWGSQPIAIASEVSLPDVDESIREIHKRLGETKKVSRKRFYKLVGEYIVGLGFEWTSTMGIGQGCTVHLREGELPNGRLIVKCSSELVAVIDGVVHHYYDPRRGGYRCVYGYWKRINKNKE